MFRYYRDIFIVVLSMSVLMASGCSRNRPVDKPMPAKTTAPVVVKEQAKPGKPEEVKKSNPAKDPVPAEEPIPKIGFVQKYVSLNWIDNGQTRMKAKSREFRGDEITKQGVFVDFTAELYENGKLTATMQAPKAVVDGDKRTVIASGGVKMKSMTRKTSLVAEKVTWYAKDKKIVGSGGVKVNSTTGDITAAEIETDTMLSKIAVRGSR
jgi:hypothetical protein